MDTLDKILTIKQESIVDSVKRWGVDAIVNTAHPTLRRGDKDCVDGAINKKIDEASGETDKLQEIIEEEWAAQYKGNPPIVKCKRGDILVTSGGDFCRYIIHTVGPENDNDGKWPAVSSSRCTNILRKCYRKIIFEALQNAKIKKIAIPVISAGNYRLDFEQAFKVGISEVYNVLLEEKRKDPEMFEYAGIEKIYFCINDENNFEIARKLMMQYRHIFKMEKRIVVFKTWESQAKYLKEIRLYDSQKGYFSIAKGLRTFVVLIRFFSIYTYLKDWLGKECWEHRRQVVEVVVCGKLLLYSR